EKDPNIPGGKARSLPVPNSGIGGRRNLPAEHGFRFFPGFYQHITDTMKRIPFRNDSVFHNLVDTSRLLIGRANHEPFVAISRFPQNLTDWEQAFEDYFKISETGLTKDDIHFFAPKLWQILTSCDDRRLAEYEKICWWDFIEASSRSIEYQDFLANGLARSLTANNPHIGNTRTLGNIYLQLILGVFDPGSSTDRLLNGPTNEVWIDPWLSYLEGLGVKYKLGAEVGKVKLSNGAISSVQILYSNNIEEWVEGDYFIFSVPVEVMGTILENNPEITSLDPKLSGIITLKNDVAWMNGLMFYLNEDVPIVNGHQLYVNSPWSITAVSQAQFWKDFQFQNCGNGNVKGILSTDISNWEAPGIIYNKPACDLEDEKIKEEVWAQLKLSLNVNGKEILKDSMIETWYLDP
ncbi:MAG: phytoene dehydrogenase, partial [Spirochaetia bacterium]|nr:phytoene dehydrogenase [Spirochaetia bacterium]